MISHTEKFHLTEVGLGGGVAKTFKSFLLEIIFMTKL